MASCAPCAGATYFGHCEDTLDDGPDGALLEVVDPDERALVDSDLDARRAQLLDVPQRLAPLAERRRGAARVHAHGAPLLDRADEPAEHRAVDQRVDKRGFVAARERRADHVIAVLLRTREPLGVVLALALFPILRQPRRLGRGAHCAAGRRMWPVADCRRRRNKAVAIVGTVVRPRRHLDLRRRGVRFIIDALFLQRRRAVRLGAARDRASAAQELGVRERARRLALVLLRFVVVVCRRRRHDRIIHSGR